jgi:hypothetical protein
VVPEVTDAKVAEGNTELSVLSGLVHGNGPNGLAATLDTWIRRVFGAKSVADVLS